VKSRFPNDEKDLLRERTKTLKTFLAGAPRNAAQFSALWNSRNLQPPWFDYDRFCEIRSDLFKLPKTSFDLMISVFVESSVLRASHYQEMLIDEAQDLDMGLLNMLTRLKEHSPRAKAVFCGDPLQSIYGFKGSLPAAMSDAQRVFECAELPLQTCFRCPENIVVELKKRFPRSQLVPAKKGGLVNHAAYDEVGKKLRDGSKAYLARSNSQLMKRSLDLVAQSIPHTFASSDVGQRMLKIVSYPSFSIAKSRLVAAAHFDKFDDEVIDEKVDIELSLSILAGRSTSVEELKSLIRELFLQPKSKSTFVLSTVHGAKGLEWDTVFLEMHQLGKPRRNASRFEVEQEQNLLYVGFTRAKQTLFLVR
jgi:superfamily I DNA/RNA helicase